LADNSGVNGGPGSSSLKGLVSQLGPFRLDDASFDSKSNTSSNLTLFPNPDTWNRVSSILYLEQPAAVGFSYCNATLRATTGKDNCDHTDLSVAADNFAFLQEWFKLFPEFLPNDLYLSGVSYGGIYVPTLAQKILEAKDTPFNLKGVTVGNPSFRWGDKSGNFAKAPASVQSVTEQRMLNLAGHGQFSPTLFKQIQATCTFFNNNTVEPASECSALLDRMKLEVGGYDLYNIYDQCKLAGDDLMLDLQLGDSPNLPLPREHATLNDLFGLTVPETDDLAAAARSRTGLAPHDDRGGECGQERALTAWANEPDVRTALHVLSEAELGPYSGSSRLNYGTSINVI
jgi:serine carboxypeptidase-like clade 1